MNKYEQILKLTELKESGALTEEEFLKEKEKILGKSKLNLSKSDNIELIEPIKSEKKISEKSKLNLAKSDNVESVEPEKIEKVQEIEEIKFNDKLSLIFKEYDFNVSITQEYFKQIQFNDKCLKLIPAKLPKFKTNYENLKNMDNVIININETANKIISEYAQEILNILLKAENYEYNLESILETIQRHKCSLPFYNAYNKIKNTYSEIILEQKEKERLRELRKAERERTSSSDFNGDSFDRNVKSIGVNILSGIGHSLVNSVGNAISESEANEKKAILFNNPQTKNNLINGLNETLLLISKTFNDLLFEATTQDKIIEGQKRAKTLFENIETSQLPKDKYINQLSKCINLDISNDIYFKKLFEIFQNDKTKVEQLFEFTYKIKGMISDAYLQIEYQFLRNNINEILSISKNDINKAQKLLNSLKTKEFMTTLFNDIVFKELNDILKNISKLNLNNINNYITNSLKLFGINTIDNLLLSEYLTIIKSKIIEIIKSETTENLEDTIDILTSNKNIHKIIVDVIEELFPNDQKNYSKYLEKCFTIFDINYIELVTKNHKKIYTFFISKIDNLFKQENLIDDLKKKINIIQLKFNVLEYIKYLINEYNKKKEANKSIFNLLVQRYNLLNNTSLKIDDLSEFKEFKQNFENNNENKRNQIDYLLIQYKQSFGYLYQNSDFKIFLKEKIIGLGILIFFINVILFAVIIAKVESARFNIGLVTSIFLITTSLFIIIISKIRWNERLTDNKKAYDFIISENLDISKLENILPEITLTEDILVKEKLKLNQKISEILLFKEKLINNNTKTSLKKILIFLAVIEISILSFFIVKSVIGPFDMIINSNILDVKIYINDKERGLLPFKETLFRGNYKIKLVKKDYENYTSEIDLDSDLNRNIELVRSKFDVSIDTNIDKSKLYINGEFKGELPFKEKLIKGNYKIKITRENYEDYESEINLNDDFDKIIKLKKLFFDIKINTNIPKVKFYIGNEYKGETPFKMQLKKGNYQMKLSKDNYEDYSFELNVLDDFDKIFDMVLIWPKQFGTIESEEGKALTKDSKNNIIITGFTKGSLDNFNNSGNEDIYLTKYDESGNKLWIQQLGTNNEDVSYSIKTDKNNNIYICGYTKGNLKGDNNGDKDVFLAKYDENGKNLWVQQFGTDKEDFGRSISIDNNGNIFVTGWTLGVMNETFGGYDSFLVKFDNNGNYQWAKQFGTKLNEFGSSIEVDKDNNIYITGWTQGAFNGDKNNGKYDVFLIKFDNDGNEKWSKQIGTKKDDYAYFLAIDESNNIFITGYTEGMLEDNKNFGNKDVFLAKYDENGEKQWLKQWGNENSESGIGLFIKDNNIFITGYVFSEIKGSGVLIKGDGFLAKFDKNGIKKWNKEFGTTSNRDYGYSVVVNDNNGIFITGFTEGNLEDKKNSGKKDIFLIKFDDN